MKYKLLLELEKREANSIGNLEVIEILENINIVEVI